jgi:hypothetical protein
MRLLTVAMLVVLVLITALVMRMPSGDRTQVAVRSPAPVRVQLRSGYVTLRNVEDGPVRGTAAACFAFVATSGSLDITWRASK